MKHLTPINMKAERIERSLQDPGLLSRSSPGARQLSLFEESGPGIEAAEERGDVVALQQGPPQQPQQGPHFPLGCSLQFDPGWEVDSSGGTAGLCQPVERDLFDCHTGCYWPAQVPDQLNHAPDWTSKCASAQKDWRKLDLIFP